MRQESVDGYNCFLMKDEAAVEDAVAQGATRLSEGSISVAVGTLGDFATTSP